MRKRKLNFEFVGALKEELILLAQREVVFVKVFGSKMYRVFSAPTYKVDLFGNIKLIDNTELVQVLNTICTRYHKGVWYFRIPDKQTYLEIGQILLAMNHGHLFVEPDEKILN